MTTAVAVATKMTMRPAKPIHGNWFLKPGLQSMPSTFGSCSEWSIFSLYSRLSACGCLLDFLTSLEYVPQSSVTASILNLKSSLGEPGAVFQLSRSVPGEFGAKVGECQAGRISLSMTAVWRGIERFQMVQGTRCSNRCS